MNKEEFIKERTRIISEMLDNPDKYEIYPTSKCFQELDKLFDTIVKEENLNIKFEENKTEIINHDGKKYKVIEVLEDYEKIIYKNKEFRIYEWSDKVEKFKYPKGFKMSEFQEFNELIENKKIILKEYKYYYVKHFNKLFWSKKYCLSRLYLNEYDLNSVSDSLLYFDRNGRVVCVRNLK